MWVQISSMVYVFRRLLWTVCFIVNGFRGCLTCLDLKSLPIRQRENNVNIWWLAAWIFSLIWCLYCVEILDFQVIDVDKLPALTIWNRYKAFISIRLHMHRHSILLQLWDWNVLSFIQSRFMVSLAVTFLALHLLWGCYFWGQPYPIIIKVLITGSFWWAASI